MRIKSWDSVVPPLAFFGLLRYFDDYRNIKFQFPFPQAGASSGNGRTAGLKG